MGWQPTSEHVPATSVVVPAYNAARTLGACLHALQHQTASPSDYEIIVVDDGSIDETASVAAGAGVQVLHQPHAGPAAARNLGVGAARGQIIMFTDADCRPAPDWVEQMRGTMRAPDVTGAKGAYLTTQRAIVARLAQLEFEERYVLLAKPQYIDFFDTHALALDKAAFQAIGGFDPFFPVPNNEDVDLAYRFSRHGYRVVFNRGAVVHHSHPDTWRKYARQKFWRGYWRMQVYRRYPGKAVADSYTPQTLKIQIALTYAILVMLPLRWPVFQWTAAIAAVGLAASMLPLMSLAWHLDRAITLFVPLFVTVRALTIGAGSLLGLSTIAGIAPLLTPRRPAHERSYTGK